jgi:hypothetical protein
MTKYLFCGRKSHKHMEQFAQAPGHIGVEFARCKICYVGLYGTKFLIATFLVNTSVRRICHVFCKQREYCVRNPLAQNYEIRANGIFSM